MNQTIHPIIQYLEQWAPPVYQESYDNSGLITGNLQQALTGILVTLDCTEEVVEEAIEKGCNLIVAHHPIVFTGIKKLNGKNYVERAIIKAIKNDVAIYAIHTNLDNVAHGVNAKIAERLGLNETQILLPKQQLLKKIFVYVPQTHLQTVQQAMFNAGAGKVGNYEECSFYSQGFGTFKGNALSNGFVGEQGKQHTEPEFKLEVLVDEAKLNAVVAAMIKSHPYEEVAYDVVNVLNTHKEIGSGMIGHLPNAMSEQQFLAHVKHSMNLKVIKFTPFEGSIKKVAVCGGSGSFLLKTAISAGAQAFVTGDFKYHEFFDAEQRLLVADIGHYESEIFTNQLIADEILKNFPKFAVILSQKNTNPINYYI